MFTRSNAVCLSIVAILAGSNPRLASALSLVPSLAASLETDRLTALDPGTIVATELSKSNALARLTPAPPHSSQEKTIVFNVSPIIAQLGFTDSLLRSAYLRDPWHSTQTSNSAEGRLSSAVQAETYKNSAEGQLSIASKAPDSTDSSGVEVELLSLSKQALLDLQTELTLSPHSSAPGGMSVHGCTVALGGGAEWCERTEASQF